MSSTPQLSARMKAPFSDNRYILEGTCLAFYQNETGISNEAELKKHILSVAAKTYDEYAYPYITAFAFTQMRIIDMPMYQKVLELGRTRADALFLDLACGFGNILRKVVADGWPVENAIASDLNAGLWSYGHELFKSTAESFPAALILGDVFDPAFIAPRAPFIDTDPGLDSNLTPVDPRSLTSLTPLQGRLSAIHTSLFFHLFTEAEQLIIAQRLASLLAPTPGAVIFGEHTGKPEAGLYTHLMCASGSMFCHSPASWTALWDGEVFEHGTVRVDCGLGEMYNDWGHHHGFSRLWWCVTRL
ncbi:hypothetical protein H0H81_011533 [Sphagnurus paluster]|uniref:Methyltransferase domain-containing protein n=1 Tax=Sphagnurus paluster TaxID=117069 RepID=A0A9P7KFS3_9AGAR|nr:hypothetical protein H0H81_011533 [Sphagnurus paluster]